MARRTHSQNAWEVSLTSLVDSTTLVLPVDSTAGLQVPCYLVVDPDRPDQREYIRVEAVDGLNLDVQALANRGIRGSTADKPHDHDIGAKVRAVAVAQWLEDIFRDIEDLEGWDASHLAAADPHPLYLLDATAQATYLKLIGGHLRGDVEIDGDVTIHGLTEAQKVRSPTPADNTDDQVVPNIAYLEQSQSDQDTALMRYAVNVYADAVTRDAQFPDPTVPPHDGYLAFLTDEQKMYVWMNGAWDDMLTTHQPLPNQPDQARLVENVDPFSDNRADYPLGVSFSKVNGHATIGNADILTVKAASDRMIQIAIGQNGDRMWFRGRHDANGWDEVVVGPVSIPTPDPAPHLESGTVTVGPGGAAGHISEDKVVTFAAPFDKVPVVVITPASEVSSPGGAQRSATFTVKAKSTTGFHIVGEHADGAGNAWPGAGVVFDWMAVST